MVIAVCLPLPVVPNGPSGRGLKLWPLELQSYSITTSAREPPPQACKERSESCFKIMVQVLSIYTMVKYTNVKSSVKLDILYSYQIKL